MGANVEVDAAVPPDERGPDGRDAAGVVGAGGAVGWAEFSRRPVSDHQSVSEERKKSIQSLRLLAGALAGEGADETTVLAGSNTMGTATGAVATTGAGTVAGLTSACMVANTLVIGVLTTGLYAAGAGTAFAVAGTWCAAIGTLGVAYGMADLVYSPGCVILPSSTWSRFECLVRRSLSFLAI